MIPAAKKYAIQRVVPDATFRNWNSYQKNTTFETGVNVLEAFQIMPDPQTNGGLLFSVDPNHVQDIQNALIENQLGDFVNPIGEVMPVKEKRIYILP